MKPLTLVFILIATLTFARAASLPEGVVDEDGEDQQDQRDKRALNFLADKITKKFASKFGHYEGPPGPPPPQHELEYGPPITSYHTKNFDIWAFKKAILNALFQAVKAIKGGIIAVKGQILKAKGQILATKGNILAAKGEAITNFGRQVAAKSLLEPPVAYGGDFHASLSASGPSGYGAASTAAKAAAPPPLPTKSSYPEYNAPAQPTYNAPSESTYGAPLPTADTYGLFKDQPKEQAKDYGQAGGLPNGVQAGLLVLKPISIPSTGGAGGHFAEPPGSYESPQINIGSAGGYSINAAANAGSFGYAGPLSPATYDAFGGHSDLSASFSQAALQGNQKKRASPPQPQQQSVQIQQHPVHVQQQPTQQYRQVPPQLPPHRGVQLRGVPQRTVHPRAVPPPQFYYQSPQFGTRL